MNIFQKIILAILFTGFLPFLTLAAEATPDPCPNPGTFGCFEVGLPGSSELKAGATIDDFIGKGAETKPILKFINTAVNVVIAILVIIGVISTVIGGYMYMTAGGDGGRVKLAKEMILAALVGIFLSLISVVILNTINKYLGSEAQEPKLGETGAGGTAGGGTGGSGTEGTGTSGGGAGSLPSSGNTSGSTAGVLSSMGLQIPQSIAIQPKDLIMLADGKVVFQGVSYDPTSPQIGQALRSANVTNSDVLRLLVHRDAVVPTMVFPFKQFLSQNAGIPFENIVTPQLDPANSLRGQFIIGP